MSKRQFKYVVATIITILLGIFSRKLSFLPAETGDALYAVMIFFLLSSIFTQQPSYKIAVYAWLVCCAIEISQLYQAAWLQAIRATKIGALVLGHGFLWVDIFAYAVGVTMAFMVSKKIP